MDTSTEGGSKKTALEELTKDELLAKCKVFLSIAQKAKQAKDALIDENTKLKDQLKESKSDANTELIIETLTNQKLDLQSKYEELKSQQSFWDNRFVTCEKELKEAKLQLSDLDTNNQSFKRQIKRLTDENDELIGQLDDLVKQIDELKKIGLEQQDQLLALERNNILLSQNTNEQDNVSLKEKLSQLEEILSLKDQTLHQVGEELITKNNQIHAFETKLNQTNNDCLEETKTLSKTIETLKNDLLKQEQELYSCKSQIIEKNKENDKNVNLIDDINTELHKYRALSEQLKLDVQNSNTKLSDNQIMSSGVASDLENANDKLRGKLKLYHSKIVKFAGDIKKLKECKNEVIAAFRVYTSQVNEWKGHLKILAKRIEENANENKRITEENNSYITSIQQITLENENLHARIKEYEANHSISEQVNTLTNINHSFEEEVINLKQNLVKETEVRTGLEQVLASKEQECLNLALKYEKYDVLIQNLKETNLILEETKNKLVEENKSLNDEIGKLKSAYDDIQKRAINNDSRELTKMTEEFITLNKQLNDSQSREEQYLLQIENFEKSIEELSKINQVTNRRIKELQVEYEKNQSDSFEVTSMNKKLQNEIHNLEITIEDQLKQIDEFITSDETYKSTIKDMETVIEKLNLEKIEVTAHNEKLKIDIENAQARIADNDSKYSVEINELKMKVNEMQDLNNNLIKTIKENQNSLEKYVHDVENLDKVNKDLLKKLDKTKSEEIQLAEKSSEEIIKQVNENKQLNEVIRTLESRVYELEHKHVEDKNVQTDQDALEEKINSLKRENAELLSEMNEMNQALKERGETISKQQAYCEEVLKKLQNYETQSNSNKDLLVKQEEVIDKLQKEIDLLKSDSKEVNFENNGELLRKNEEITTLKAEIEELKLRVNNLSEGNDVSYAESENMSTSTISRNDEVNRMKDIEGSWEERYAKLRNLAVKLKAKIRENQTEISKEQTEKLELQQKLAKTVQTFQQQIDKLQDDLDSSKKEANSYLKKLDSVAIDVSKDKKKLAENEEVLSKLRSEIENLNKDKQNVDNWKKQISAKVQTLKKELDANNVLKKEFENQVSKLNSELEAKDKLLRQEMEKHTQTKSTLLESTTECKKQSVLSLEIQDYERSVKELTQKIDKKQEIINKLKSQMDTQKTTITTLREQLKNAEDNVKIFEDQLNVTNEDNGLHKKKIADLQNLLTEKETRIQDLTYSIENVRSDNEDLSTQLSRAIAEHEKLNVSLKHDLELLRRKNMGLEDSLRITNQNLQAKEQELDEIRKEYDSYKVRAQSVLRQNQSRDIGAEEKLKEESDSLNAQVDILTSDLKELRVTVEALTAENGKLTAEKLEMKGRMDLIEVLYENTKKEFEKLTQKHQQVVTEHSETIRGLKLHADTLAQCYRQQLTEQEAKYHRELIDLQSRIDRNNTPPEFSSLIIPSMPREEGEGSESVDSTTVGGTQPVPLEKLLSNEMDQEASYIRKQLVENESKVAHLTALLADTEQDLAKHAQMNKVLKEEIRRQQRSVEREEHAENLEYLKNVVLKFLTLGYGDERERLVPVLNTILKLSPEETHKLTTVARGEKGWSNYLPIWGSSPSKPQ